MSSAGMFSVMQTIRSTPASAASNSASTAKAAGTKMMLALASVAATASCTVSKTGVLPTAHWPPRPGTAPATTLVPYWIICCAWNAPWLPVIPCTSRRVS